MLATSSGSVAVAAHVLPHGGDVEQGRIGIDLYHELEGLAPTRDHLVCGGLDGRCGAVQSDPERACFELDREDVHVTRLCASPRLPRRVFDDEHLIPLHLLLLLLRAPGAILLSVLGSGDDRDGGSALGDDLELDFSLHFILLRSFSCVRSLFLLLWG